MNTIIIQFCEEDRQRIDELISAAMLIAGELKGRPQIRATEEPTAKPEPQVIEMPAPAPVAEPAPEVKPVSLSEFQKAVTLAVSKGPDAKKATKAIINKYADSVSAVPEDKRADIIAELANI